MVVLAISSDGSVQRHLTALFEDGTLFKRCCRSAIVAVSSLFASKRAYSGRRRQQRSRIRLTTATQVKRTQMPSSPTSVISVVHVSPANTASARVSVPVVTISPAASGGLT